MPNLFDRFFRRKPEPDLDAIRTEARLQGQKEAAQEMAKQIAERMVTSMAPMPIAPMPSSPVTKPTHGAYGLDKPITFTTPQPPSRHPGSLVSVETLRLLADTYDILRDCINHLKKEVAATPFKIVPRNEEDKGQKTLARCKAAMTLFEREGAVGRNGQYYQHFESKIFEDVLVVGASAIYHRQNALGGWMDCDAIDSATIRPMIDTFGWSPEKDTDEAYEQWIYGVQVVRLSRIDLDYDGLYPRTQTPYFYSPVEWLINVVNGALRADSWNLTWLTDGNTPDEIYSLPAEWSVESVIQFAAWWDSLLSGNTIERRKSRFLPGGTGSVKNNSRKDQDFAVYELWLMRRTCAIFDVQPASIGFTGEQYKVTQDESMNATTQFGVGPLLKFRKNKLDDILFRAGYGDLQVVDANDEEDESEVTDTCARSIETGQMTPNEARQRRGLKPVEGGDTLFVSSTLVPLEQAIAPPEPMPDPTNPDDPNPEKPPKTARVERKKKA